MKSVRGTYVTVTAVTAGLIMALSGSAQADPAEDLERQLNAKWSALESTIEQYNKTAETLKITKADIDAASVKIKPLQDQVDAAHAKVGALSAAAYRGGKASTVNALLSGNSPDSMLEQLTILDAIGVTEQRQINELNRIKAPLDEEKNKIQTLLETQQQMETELAAKKVAITQEMDDLQSQWSRASKDRASRNGQRETYMPSKYIPGPPGVAVRYALRQLGKPYVWYTAGPDTFDCSGLTLAAWGDAGVKLGHYTGWQRDATTPVSRANLQPGDLIFYGGEPRHVAMYIGDGYMVHAPQAGDVVKVATVDSVEPPSGYGRPQYAR